MHKVLPSIQFNFSLLSIDISCLHSGFKEVWASIPEAEHPWGWWHLRRDKMPQAMHLQRLQFCHFWRQFPYHHSSASKIVKNCSNLKIHKMSFHSKQAMHLQKIRVHREYRYWSFSFQNRFIGGSETTSFGAKDFTFSLWAVSNDTTIEREVKIS